MKIYNLFNNLHHGITVATYVEMAKADER